MVIKIFPSSFPLASFPKILHTYDSTKGWFLMGRRTKYITSGKLLINTRDGVSFESVSSFEFPTHHPHYGPTACLETLDNGGDLFGIGKTGGWGHADNATFIFRSSSSTWERQADVPGTTKPPQVHGKSLQFQRKVLWLLLMFSFPQ